VRLSSAQHTPTDNPAQTYTLPATNDLTQWHNFALDWQPTVLSFSVDGQTYWTVHKSDFRTWPFDKPFFLILNYAVGGQMGGDIPASAPLPYTMSVSYAKVYNSEITK
jgi:beta-glucanase (GH16 family)